MSLLIVHRHALDEVIGMSEEVIDSIRSRKMFDRASLASSLSPQQKGRDRASQSIECTGTRVRLDSREVSSLVPPCKRVDLVDDTRFVERFAAMEPSPCGFGVRTNMLRHRLSHVWLATANRCFDDRLDPGFATELEETSQRGFNCHPLTSRQGIDCS